MWKDWKEKLIDFFYKEVEVEEENEHINHSDEPSYGVEKYRLASIEQNNEDVKIAYQYPKQEMGAFRFPVIPDEKETTMYNQSISKHQKRRQTKRTHRSHKNKQLLIHGHQRRPSQKELEDIPAFMRRNKASSERIPVKSQEAMEESVSDDQSAGTEKEAGTDNTKKILPHSKPDELDKVFQKRDGKLPVTEYQISTTETDSGKPEAGPDNEYSVPHSPEKIEGSDPQTKTNHTSMNNFQVNRSERDHNRARTIHNVINEEINSDKPVSKIAPSMGEQQTEVISDEKPVPDYLLNDPAMRSDEDDDWVIEQQILLEDTFTHFNIDITVVNVTQGPAVTRFEIQPALGVKVSKIKNLSDDLKLNLAAKDIRIEAPIPGKNTIGIEVPNQYPQVVSLQEIIETDVFKTAESPLTIALGLTIEGVPMITNINKMPHGLIAGATGSGKSVCINTIILSLLYKANHEEVKLLLIDPKMVELTPYNQIPHLISPVITDVKAATKALKWAVNEMEARYEKFVELGVRNIQKYNEKIDKSAQHQQEKMTYIVIIIDELADLMMVSPQEVEDAICRIAQKARACGIHLLLATQRPSVDVITGLIKANIPTRIAFSVSSQVDSRTMIDSNGAEKLLGRGDMLFLENGAGKTIRLQGPFVSDEEIDRVASYVRSIAEPNYLFEEEQLLLQAEENEEDDLMNDVKEFVMDQGQASTSLLQRRFRIGYNRAARLIDSLEHQGIITGHNGSKPREILITKEQIEKF